jgi:hypothetical protein
MTAAAGRKAHARERRSDDDAPRERWGDLGGIFMVFFSVSRQAPKRVCFAAHGFFSVFVEGGLLNCIDCNPAPDGARNHPHEALWDSGLPSADSGLQLDLEIALNGVSAKIQPLRLIQPCRRCVETSDDVIDEASTWCASTSRPFILIICQLVICA